jgi:SNF2 family DNA or RNA helicase
MEFRRHHGKTRLLDASELDGVNIVLTTYHTVSAEWKPSNYPGSSVLFSVRWQRIILDEGLLSTFALEYPTVSRANEI